MRIFLAAPLFSEAERDFNSKVARELRNEGFEVWLAQELKFINSHSTKEKQSIFRDDLSALQKSDVIVAVLDGVDVDTGVAFEMGFGHAMKKPIIGLKTDHRVFSKLESVNLMLETPLAAMCENSNDVARFLRDLKKK
ncbi:MAG: nucleoside 2-deoxyribosyltransferase domain-containing protein [Candidatus Atabeyarchaeum deiterrae]